ncbi:MAG: DUF885 domain-containing protein [Methanobacteriota archaeon]|nr:MAG: DUF885 domain-containing protein [Euryarchaeota archaeon]
MAEFVEWVLKLHKEILEENPIFASSQGDFSFAHRWPNISKQGIERLSQRISGWIERSSQFEGKDAELVRWFLEFAKFELDGLRFWEKIPGLAGIILSGCFHLVVKTTPEEERRLEALVKRLETIGPLVEATKQRVVEPYRIWQEAEKDSLNGLESYLKTLPKHFVSERDRLQEAVQKALKELATYRAWLDKVHGKEGLPVNKETYAELIAMRKLGLELDEILELANKYLKETEMTLEQIARTLGGDVATVRQNIREDHPPSYEIALQDYRKLAAEAKQFLLEKDLLTMPDERLEVIFTPEPMRRFLSIAAAGSPGLFERDKTGYFYLTPHEDKKMLEEHNYSFQSLLISHESYPGHHIHGACKNLQLSPARSSILANILPFSGLRYSSKLADITEGWGLYCEQMMFDQGFKNDLHHPDLRKKFLLANALRWRATRVIIDISLHTGKMSFEDAVDYLIKNTGYNEQTARSEILMYSQSPGYFLSYMLGKHLIMKLKKDTELPLKEFHNRILYAGNVPFWFLKDEIYFSSSS